MAARLPASRDLVSSHADPTPPRDHAVVFARVVSELRVAVARPEVRLTEVPAPGRIAPYAYAVTADVSG